MASTIMVIDDDPQMCRLIGIILGNEGSRVLLESDPIRGLEILKSEPVDVLFTDLRMPGCDGLEVIREARRVCPGLAVGMFHRSRSPERVHGFCSNRILFRDRRRFFRAGYRRSRGLRWC